MPITITTWNVQNLAKSDLAFADKLDFLVGTLQALASDIVALQEILDLNALQDLATRLGFQPVAATPDGRGNRVAFLTRNVLARPPQQIDQWQLAQGVEVRDFQATGPSVSCRGSPARPFKSPSRTTAESSTSSLHT